jgi:hypothetical protein
MVSNSRISEVDAAVRAVLATLRPGPESSAAEIFAGALLGERDAEALPASTRAVGVAPSTVVTPLAHQVLKRRGIALRLVSTAALARVKHPGEWAFAVTVADPDGSGTIAALRRAWLVEGWAELEGSDRVDRLAGWVAEAPVRGGLVLTDEASVIVWRACRMAGVRAAVAADCDAVARAVRHLGVNLLVVEPRGKSISWLRRLAGTYRQSGAPAPPAEIAGVETDRAREACRCGLPR